MLIPPLVHIPIFIGTTLTIREACNRSFSSLQHSTRAIEAGSESLSTDSTLATLALESLAWCPSLTDVDPYSAFPLLVGITALLNVETQAKIRQQMAELRDAASAGPEDSSGPEARSTQVSGAVDASRPHSPKRVARPVPVVPKILQKKSLSTNASSRAASSEGTIVSSTSALASTSNNASAARSRAITNVLRFASIMFIPIAAASPVVSDHQSVMLGERSLTDLLVRMFDNQGCQCLLVDIQ